MLRSNLPATWTHFGARRLREKQTVLQKIHSDGQEEPATKPLDRGINHALSHGKLDLCFSAASGENASARPCTVAFIWWKLGACPKVDVLLSKKTSQEIQLVTFRVNVVMYSILYQDLSTRYYPFLLVTLPGIWHLRKQKKAEDDPFNFYSPLPNPQSTWDGPLLGSIDADRSDRLCFLKALTDI